MESRRVLDDKGTRTSSCARKIRLTTSLDVRRTIAEGWPDPPASSPRLSLFLLHCADHHRCGVAGVRTKARAASRATPSGEELSTLRLGSPS
ncbi:unnamed protein product [Ixodes pacificus]